MRKHDFPQLTQDIVHLDSAATAPKPRVVLEAMQRFYETDYANVNRGVYGIAARATEAFAVARAKVATFIGAARAEEIVFTRNATEAINVVATSWGTRLVAGDEIILTALEHHANIVPWQLLAQRTGAVIKVVPLQADGSVALADVEKAITPRTKIITCAHVSNVLGTVLPVEEICALARVRGIATLIDGCQAVAHRAVNVQQIGCDFYVFSAHKLYGPSGIGVLVGRYDVLESMPPYQGGGDMIEHVRFSGTTFRAPPHRFEAGTPAIAEAIGLAAAIDYVNGISMNVIAAYGQALLLYATQALQKISGLIIHGTAARKEPIVCFSIAGMQPYDLATIADNMGICMRVGQHCAEPLHDTLGIAATARVSFAIYNTEADVDALVAAINKAKVMLKCA